MAVLRVSNLYKSFGVRELFGNVSFEVAPKEHVGVVGVNGCGKTTLFRILMGEEPYDRGSVSIASGAKVNWLQQRPQDGKNRSLYEETLEVFRPLMDTEAELERIAKQLEKCPEESLIRRQYRLQEEYQQQGGMTYRSRTRAVLLGLGFEKEALDRPIDVMSGGEARKALLARVLLSGADLLLLDEPTNHLDIGAIEWLESFLTDYKGACLVISHDRYFLDRVTGTTLEMANGTVTAYKGNYSAYLAQKLSNREAAERRYYNGLKEIRRIQGIIEQQRRWNQAHNYVTIASKEKQIERLRKELVKPEQDPSQMRFRFQAADNSGNDVVITKELSMGFDGRQLFHDADMHILKGEHVCLLGANGCGKTTLLKILLGQEEPTGGSYRIGANVMTGYYEQSLSGLNPALTVIEQLSDLFPRMDYKELRNALGQFLFRGDDVFRTVGELSGGELARLQLLKLMLQRCNLLLLDEPTNHLDIPSREALETALSSYDGTMLIVTHDRYFVDRVADRVLILSPEGIRNFGGDWTLYRQGLEETAREPEEERPRQAENLYLVKRELRSELTKRKTAFRKTEEEISTVEERQEELNGMLQLPAVASDYERAGQIMAELQELPARLESLYRRWEELDGEIRDIETKLSE